MGLRQKAKTIFFAMTRVIFIFRTFLKKSIRQSGGIQYWNTGLAIDSSSTCTLGRGVTLINSQIIIGRNCRVSIAENSVLRNVRLMVTNAQVTLEEGVILNYQDTSRGVISIDSGSLHLGKFVNIKANLSIRFSGRVKIGTYTGIGPRSEIVCDEAITIGNFGLISSDVDIYDTNSHSTFADKRRERIRIGYPVGCSETEKPSTTPIIIGDDVWIGKGSQILKGSQIGSRSIVGLGTKVTPGAYPEDSLIVNEKAKTLTLKK